jgi:S1-C subfamily serine protease/uncharacterized membrane protein YfcA
MPLISKRRLSIGLALVGALALTGLVSRSASAQEATDALARFEEATRAAVSRVRAAVVRISALKTESTVAPAGPGGQAVPLISTGTGLIVDPRGYVLTNAHVVMGARSIAVGLWRSPPEEIAAEIVDLNESRDLALIRLAGGARLPHATLGNSQRLEVGDWVLAIGSPYGLDHSVTRGIVSDRARSLMIQGRLYRNLIQTDAAINQGNSGGPLIDMQGQVVGISTAIYAPDGVSAGVGFAIPANRARRYMKSALPSDRPGLLAAVAKKEPITVGTPAPHPALGRCTNCHELIVPANAKAAAGSRPAIGHTVAAASPNVGQQLAPMPADGAPPHQVRTAEQDWTVIQRGTGLVLASSALFNMLGLGGGFVYVPILLFFGVDFHVASATSLFVIMAAHISALFVFLRSRLVDYKLALVLEPVTCVGSLLGGLSSGLISGAALSALFGVLLLLSAYLMHRGQLKTKALPAARPSRWTWHRSFGPHEYGINLALGLPLMLVVGYLGGMLGFAGGWLKIPMLVLLFGVPIKVAIATSSLMVGVTSLVGCIGHGIEGHFDPRLAIALALAAIIGAQIGARLTIRADRLMLKRIFTVVLLGVSLWMVGRVL